MREHLTDLEVSVRHRGTRRRARYLCALVLLQLTAGCSAWRSIPGGSLSRAEAEPIDHARVFLRDGTELEFKDARITPDSIIGLGGATSTRLAVARIDVTGMDTRRTEPVTTFLGGVLAGVAGVFLTLSLLFS